MTNVLIFGLTGQDGAYLSQFLLKKGYTFKSESDSEVIIASYIEYGQNCVKLFNGMWAFTLYDISNNELFVSIDRLGIKPFYYSYEEGNNFIFSCNEPAVIFVKTQYLF